MSTIHKMSHQQLLTVLRKTMKLQHELLNKLAKENREDILYHGSTRLMDRIQARKAIDVGGDPSNNQTAVYATDMRNFAISMGLTSKGSDVGHFWSEDETDSEFQSVLYNGDIRHGEYVYLYTLPRFDSNNKDMFVKSSTHHEFYSKPGIKYIEPLKVEKLKVDDYLHLLRKPNKEDLAKRKKYI